ncbi:hypothetical protein DFH09DRAFT_1292462 [Mycena vulgaris]|nr:hypothetical protein DFH09DRAFT_1292462 [Mycena vulgaris]
MIAAAVPAISRRGEKKQKTQTQAQNAMAAKWSFALSGEAVFCLVHDGFEVLREMETEIIGERSELLVSTENVPRQFLVNMLEFPPLQPAKWGARGCSHARNRIGRGARQRRKTTGTGTEYVQNGAARCQRPAHDAKHRDEGGFGLRLRPGPRARSIVTATERLQPRSICVRAGEPQEVCAAVEQPPEKFGSRVPARIRPIPIPHLRPALTAQECMQALVSGSFTINVPGAAAARSVGWRFRRHPRLHHSKKGFVYENLRLAGMWGIEHTAEVLQSSRRTRFSRPIDSSSPYPLLLAALRGVRSPLALAETLKASFAKTRDQKTFLPSLSTAWGGDIWALGIVNGVVKLGGDNNALVS